ncbi:MAG: leucyl/phenylalanyl-tRNA--protein transferase [Acidobacteria bacterium]|nr:MAG: leucyl/phenylalanyl-tRNA--protein transferase [Acidobacteriota bacterium]REK08895.1 MAG: leucyl/phenylalanyl-tRNA--protein transferase [Acidobacteriota bacterium]
MAEDPGSGAWHGTSWQFPDPDENGAPDVVGLGADLEPGTLMTAYCKGIFPMPLCAGGPIAWWSPDPRAVLEPERLHVGRSLRKAARRYRVRVDAAFEAVIDACADPLRPNGWIDRRIRDAYVRLHRLGLAHSVEAWDDDGLAGGLYGVSIGGFFAGESMFFHRRDGSKVALLGLVERLAGAGDGVLLDVQFLTPHLRSLGAREIRRTEYLRRLQRALALPALDWRAGAAAPDRMAVSGRLSELRPPQPRGDDEAGGRADERRDGNS